MKASCGHEDALGYLAGVVCGPCARAGHARAVGRLESKLDGGFREFVGQPHGFCRRRECAPSAR
jgi:hypothetical protein